MAGVSDLPAPPHFDAAGAARLRDLLDAAAFAEMGDRDGPLSARLPRRVRRPLLERLAARDGLDAKTALLVCFNDQIAVPRTALGEDLAGALIDAGFLVPFRGDAGRLVAQLSLTRMGGAYIAADTYGTAGETVMTPGPGTMRLARLLPDVAGRRVLDLCAGPGSVGIVASGLGGDVVATDLSERCAAFMRANATLNGVQLDIRVGDLFDPVAGDRFDVVSTHPPYVERPDAVGEVMFLHGGERGDELPYRVLAGVPDVLAPGGHGFVEFQAWGTPDEVWAEVRGRLANRGCDVVLAGKAFDDLDSRAVTNAFMHYPEMGDGFDEVVVRYRDHLERMGAHFTGALLYMRRRADDTREPWAVMIGGVRLPGDWATLERYVRSVDVLDDGPDALTAAKVSPLPGSKLVVEAPLGEGTPEYSLHLPPEAFAEDRGLPAEAAQLVDRLARCPTAGDAIAAFAGDLGETTEVVRGKAFDFIRENIIRGTLLAERA